MRYAMKLENFLDLQTQKQLDGPSILSHRLIEVLLPPFLGFTCFPGSSGFQCETYYVWIV